MIGLVIFVVAIVLIIAYFFITTKINNLKYRAKQQILKGTGLSFSDIHAGVSNGLEKKQLQKFLEEHSNYTEESIKSILQSHAEQVVARNPIREFSQEVCEKIQGDAKLNKMQNMTVKRVNINHYSNSKLTAIVVYTDNRDEYNMVLYYTTLDNELQLNKYSILKGDVVGF